MLVLVLEKWGWFGELLEYCAKSELHPRSGLRCWREPDFAPSSETPDFAPYRLKLREATSGKPGGYIGQAALEDGRLYRFVAGESRE